MQKPCYIKPFRLFLYSKYIGSYDLLNKASNLGDFRRYISLNIKSLILQKKISILQQTKKQLLILGLSLEALSNQRFLLSGLKYQKRFLKITLRNIFLFLDVLLNSFFLNTFSCFSWHLGSKLFFLHRKNIIHSLFLLFDNSLVMYFNFLIKYLLVSLGFFNIKFVSQISINLFNLYFIPF